MVAITGWMPLLPVFLGWHKAKNQNTHESTMQLAKHSINVTYTIFLQSKLNKSIYTRPGDICLKESDSHVHKLGVSQKGSKWWANLKGYKNLTFWPPSLHQILLGMKNTVLTGIVLLSGEMHSPSFKEITEMQKCKSWRQEETHML